MIIHKNIDSFVIYITFIRLHYNYSNWKGYFLGGYMIFESERIPSSKYL